MYLEDLKMFKKLEQINQNLSEQVKDVYELTYETINNISRSFGNYTMHDMNHGLRVASYIEQLAFGIDNDIDENIKEFNPLELSMMILSAILHDIGMTIRDKDREMIKNGKIDGATGSLSYQGVLRVNNNNEEEAIKEIIRRLHASRIYDFLDEDMGGITLRNKLTINGNISYAEDVAEICSLHGEEHTALKEIATEKTKGDYTYNPRYIAALLRIADLLDIDKQRTPMLWYNVMNIDGFSKEEWEKHFIIENTIKLKPYLDNRMQIYFDGKNSNAKIHRKYLKYIDELKKEVENTDELLNTKTTQEKYRFRVCSRIDDRVKTEGFTYSDLRLNLDYSSITNLLMGSNIYGDSKLGLRELVQNSIDACELMKEVNNGISKYLSVSPKIYILISKEKNQVVIKDSGIGMTLEVVKKHFLNVGKSYYKSNDFLYKNCQYMPIGQYGIGFLACFLLSDNVTVRTKYYNDHEINQIELEKDSEYVVTTAQQTPNFIGTEIILDYNNFFDVFESIEDLKDFMEKCFYTSIPITIYNEDEDEKIDIKNTYKESVKMLIEKHPNKFFVINCSTYSDEIDGTLLIEKSEMIKDKNPELLSDKPVYMFDSSEQRFVLVEDINTIKSGYYFYKCYPNLSSEEYEKLNLNKSKKPKHQNFLMKQAKENKSLINLLIKTTDSKHLFTDTFLPSAEKDTKVKKIFEKSGINYYKEVFDEYIFMSTYERVFISDNKIEFINNFVFNDSRIYRSLYNNKSYCFSKYYNKGIRVNNVGFYCSYTPYKFRNVFGYINSTGSNQKLDVSRNNLIEGEKALSEEVYKIVITAIIESKSNTDEIDLLKRLLNERN